MQPCVGEELETTHVLVADGEGDDVVGQLVGDLWDGRGGRLMEANSWDGEGRRCCCSAAAGAKWRRDLEMKMRE